MTLCAQCTAVHVYAMPALMCGQCHVLPAGKCSSEGPAESASGTVHVLSIEETRLWGR